MSDLKKVLDERGANYGDFTHQAGLSQGLKQMCFNHLDQVNPAGARKFTPYMAEGLEMILHKVARIVNGEPFHLDSWRDIAGYATIVADRVEAAVSVGHVPAPAPATVHMHGAGEQTAKEPQEKSPELASDPAPSIPLCLDVVDDLLAVPLDLSPGQMDCESQAGRRERLLREQRSRNEEPTPDRSLETAFDTHVHIPDNIHRV